MLRSAFLAVAVAGLALGHAAPASANAALAGATKAPAATTGVVIDVRRGGRHGFRGGHRAFRGGNFRRFRGGHLRHHRGVRRHWRGHRRWRRGGIYFGVPYLAYRSYGYGRCGWLRRKALRTDSRYWWRRYRRCMRYYYD